MRGIDPIKRLRLRLKTVSQRQLAKQLGISQAYISDVAAGKKPVGGKLLDHLGLQKVTIYVAKDKEES